MLHGDVLVSHGLRLILRAYQRLIQILADEDLAAGNLRPFVQGIVQIFREMLRIDLHLFQHF